MLPPQRDPWSPKGPRPKEPPPPKEPLRPLNLRDAPEAADHESVLVWNDRPRVRVHLAVGNWYENRPLVISERPRDPRWISPWSTIEFNPSWYEANIRLELALECNGACDTGDLPANLAKRARDDAREMRTRGLAPRWLVEPHHAGNIWGWKLVARDKIGTIRGGKVAVDRVLPELGAFLECVGVTESRVDPVWLDRIEDLCRQMTIEMLP